MFDWERFLDGYNIVYSRTSRKNSRNRIGLNCPFCGDDEGMHLGIDVYTGFWHCWREPVKGAHSGRTPYRLIERLLGCSRETAARIVEAGANSVVANDRTFGSDIARLLGGPVTKLEFPRDYKLEFPREYHRLGATPRSRRLYYPYLTGRGYTESQVDWLVNRYRLCYATKGPFVYRIIIPVYFRDRLVTWTGRHIGDDELRYRSLSHDPETAIRTGQPQAAVNIKHTLLDFDMARIRGGHTLVITEGPFDAIRITFFGYRAGIHAVALFGKQASDEQIDLIAELTPHYRRVVCLFDVDAESEFGPFPELLNIKQRVLPVGVKDPALLTREQFGSLFGVGDN